MIRSLPHGPPRSPPTTSRSVSSSRKKVIEQPARETGKPLPPASGPYANILPQAGGAWSDGHDDDNQDDADEFAYDDAEDEFGLPTLTKIRNPKKNSRSKAGSARNRSEKGTAGFPSLTPNVGDGIRLRANSSDIAEERSLLVYPTTKPSGGKILRPQYKDILRGSTRARCLFLLYG